MKDGRGIRPKDPWHVYGIYHVDSVYEIYNGGMESSRSKKIGDGSFFDAKRDWMRLQRDFPIRKEDELRLLPRVFDKEAQCGYEEVVSSNVDASAAELWKLLEGRL